MNKQIVTKILVRILLGIGIIIIIVWIAALFLSIDFAFEKPLTINKPKTEIFNYIKYFKNRNEYSKQANMNSGISKVFSATDATLGSVSAWNSKNKDVGKSE